MAPTGVLPWSVMTGLLSCGGFKLAAEFELVAETVILNPSCPQSDPGDLSCPATVAIAKGARDLILAMSGNVRLGPSALGPRRMASGSVRRRRGRTESLARGVAMGSPRETN